LVIRARLFHRLAYFCLAAIRPKRSFEAASGGILLKLTALSLLPGVMTVQAAAEPTTRSESILLRIAIRMGTSSPVAAIARIE